MVVKLLEAKIIPLLQIKTEKIYMYRYA